MERAFREIPAEPFKVPSGITLVKVDLETGLPATGDTKEIILEAYTDGNAPAPMEKLSPRKEGPSSGPQTRILPETKTDGP